jgi:hypothetical protein
MKIEFKNGNTYKPEKKQKATLLLINVLGLPIHRHIWVRSIEVANLDSHTTWKTAKQAIKIYYIAKGKRKITGVKIEDCTIALGWQKVEGTLDYNSFEYIAFEDGLLAKLTEQLKNVLVTTLGDNSLTIDTGERTLHGGLEIKKVKRIPCHRLVQYSKFETICCSCPICREKNQTSEEAYTILDKIYKN